MTSLTDIAAEMRRACRSMAEDSKVTFHVSLRTLERSLNLSLELNTSHWQLTLTRANVAPSEEETDTCAGAFGVPEGTAVTRGVAALGNGKIIHIARLRWPRIQPQLLKET